MLKIIKTGHRKERRKKEPQRKAKTRTHSANYKGPKLWLKWKGNWKKEMCEKQMLTNLQIETIEKDKIKVLEMTKLETFVLQI